MSRLVDECHNIRRSHEDSIAGLRDGTTKVAKNLWQSIGFLGRLRSAYNDLLRAAERLPGFEELEIVSVTLGVDQSKKKPAAKPWSLAETFNSIGFSLSDSNVRKLFGQTWSKSRLLERFSSELRQPLQFHVEVQLVLYLMSAYDSTASTFNYIGCSKYSCLLCHMVVKGCGQFETRGCHGKVSSPWSIPEANGFSQNDIDRLVTLLKSMQKAIGDQICEPGRERIELRKESTVGESSIATKTDIVDEPHLQRLVSSHLHSQRQSHLAKYLEGSIDTTMVGDDESVPDLEEAPPIPSRKSGICHVCDRKTDRRCSRCQRDWFCNAHCEKEMTITHRFQCSSGALTTADYLESAVLRDEIPDDPQTLEDYGFSRCITWNQKSHLAGLYKGLLLPLKVDAKKLDRWLHEGSLVLNIIREFHRLPEGSRGSYFPWFLKNKHLLDSAEPLNESHHQQAPQVWIEEAKSYLPLEEQTRAITDMQPVARRDVFIAFAGLLQSGYPHPKWPSWYTLGFCTCRDEWEERSLGSTYNRLIGGNKIQVDYHISLGSEYSGPPQTPTCSFVEFWDAYSSGTLSELFDKYGLKQWRLRFKHLDTFLSVGYSSPRPSVWRLRHLLALDDPINIPPQLRGAVGDYGLTISMDARWKLGLLEVYRKIFSRGDPMELHAARTRGEALKYVASVVPEIDPHVALILKSLPTRY
ncbi:hypothetical protein BJY00DRAFT_277887 [Aspergillus carlsbadensis]|nr:hypothetical protein BJY00DRAFT_277887 [Aspergillus carlsbadensis]